MRVFDNLPPLFASQIGDSAAMFLAVQRLSLPDLEGRRYMDSFVHGNDLGGGFILRENGDLLVGSARVTAKEDLAAQAYELYKSLLAACRGWHLVRIWNVIPNIGRTYGGLENARAFRIGRARAFSERFGAEMQRHICSSTLIGGFGNFVDLSFVASRVQPRHLDNPESEKLETDCVQLSVFNRVTMCETDGLLVGCVPGISAVKCHDATGMTLPEQCASAEENLDGFEQLLIKEGFDPCMHRYVNVFVRRKNDEAFILDHLARHWSNPRDHTCVYRGEMCQPGRMLEVEYLAFSALRK